MATAKKPAKVERWTLDKRAAFLEHLAATCNVTASARAVGMSEKGVYRIRMTSPAFREAWAVALREGYVRLELMMLERAISGTQKPVWHGGKQVGEVTEHSERLAMQLLTAHRGAMTPARHEPEETPDAIRERLKARFAQMEARLADDGRPADAAG